MSTMVSDNETLEAGCENCEELQGEIENLEAEIIDLNDEIGRLNDELISDEENMTYVLTDSKAHLIGEVLRDLMNARDLHDVVFKLEQRGDVLEADAVRELLRG